MWILRNLCFHTPFTHARRTHPSLPESTFIQLPLFQPFTFVPNYCKTRLTFTHSHWIRHTGSFCECLSNSVKCSAISGAQKTPSPLQKGNLAYLLWPLVESCLSWERHRHWLLIHSALQTHRKKWFYCSTNMQQPWPSTATGHGF